MICFITSSKVKVMLFLFSVKHDAMKAFRGIEVKLYACWISTVGIG